MEKFKKILLETGVFMLFALAAWFIVMGLRVPV
jgi:hypothetical protein